MVKSKVKKVTEYIKLSEKTDSDIPSSDSGEVNMYFDSTNKSLKIKDINNNVSEIGADKASLGVAQNAYAQIKYNINKLNTNEVFSTKLYNNSSNDGTIIGEIFTLNEANQVVNKITNVSFNKQYTKSKIDRIFNSSDGKHIYAVEARGADMYIKHYWLEIPFDINSVYKIDNFFVNISYSKYFIISKNGKYLIVATSGASNDYFYRYTLQIPWDITTANLDQRSNNEISLYGYGGIDISPDGKHIVTDRNQYYTMSTSYDIVNITNVSTTSELDNTYSVKYSKDGKNIYFINNDNFFSMDLTTAYDITTATNKVQITSGFGRYFILDNYNDKIYCLKYDSSDNYTGYTYIEYDTNNIIESIEYNTSSNITFDTLTLDGTEKSLAIYTDKDTPTNTDITIDISDGTNSITNQPVNSIIDISSLGSGTLQLTFNLSTTDNTVTPKLYGWGVYKN